jgi:hypothetical protein
LLEDFDTHWPDDICSALYLPQSLDTQIMLC